MTKILSLLSIGMFVSYTEKVANGFKRMFEVSVAPSARALQDTLRDGQCLSDDFFHNANWYNKVGEKIGWGDLAKHMIPAIKMALPANEIFLICSEASGFWELRNEPEIDPTRPGIKWVVEKALAVITPNGIYVPIRNHQPYKHMQECKLRGAIPAQYVSEEWLHRLVEVATQTEMFLDGPDKYVIAPVLHPGLVEELIPPPWGIGEAWTCTPLSDRQDDGRWRLVVSDWNQPKKESPLIATYE